MSRKNIFPSNWIPCTIPNKRVNHCFNVEEDGKINRILITVNYFDPNKRDMIKQFAYQALKSQIAEERHRIVETNVQIREVSYPNGCGLYFTATDIQASSENTDHPVMMRCFYITSNQMIELTLLYYNPSTYITHQIFDVLKLF